MALSSEQLRQYEDDGFVFPIPVLSEHEAAAARRSLKALIAAEGGSLGHRARFKPHLRFKWVCDLAHHPNLVAPVRDLLGPDVLLWRSTFFIKSPGDAVRVPWHQDSLYWRFRGDDVVTAWLALTDSTPANGCVRVAAGTHRGAELPHRTRADPTNRLLRGQEIDADMSSYRCVDLELRAGEASLHHVRLVHGSAANPSASMRAGLALRYITAGAARDGRRDSAMPISGVDRWRNFDHEPAPRWDDDPVARSWHERSVRRYALEVAAEVLRSPGRESITSLFHIIGQRATWKTLLQSLRRMG